MLSIRVVRMPANLPPDYVDLFLSRVSAERRQKIARFVRKEDAYRSLLGEVLVRSTLSEHTGVRPDALQFVYNPYGKPFLQNTPDVGFNLSHSGNWIAMIWGDSSCCPGIDVERIVRMDLHIAEHLFTPQENRMLASKTGDARLEYFYRVWTLKESYVKAVGKGLSIPLDSFSVVCTEEQTWYSPEADGFHFTSISLDEEHILSACSCKAALPDHVQHVSLSSLYETLL
ncbi:4'-phosphopantetheinyl transferase superfamily protein [Brevibacillus sp. MCWH]|jgi:4'-phosphopantetheinyl transferase|uniref:4'-phosphopantetheinyl transferase family protein n=1 Tax=Brevibacillus sp. MCWH TaxID=2508871 RepID=UPI00149283B5|nr:4'-phosphopantetheinyl transferase superfamily protein [Brevibacillus sp. MCWH]NNV02335.1 4'-phosphopantetheinyl transferase superfamily protein [Brevibacillus sp. MCWH]